MATMRYIVDGFLALVTLVTIGWVAIRALKDSDHRSGLVARWIVTAALIAGACHFAVKLWNGGLNVAWIIPFVIMVAGLVLSILWTPALSEWAVKPLTGILDGGNEPQEARPLYSAAIAKRQRGNFVEAVVAIREQLAKFPNDLEGVMLLARIQAEDLKDLPSAEMTFNHFCANPKVPPRQFAAVMTTLADWYLQFGQDSYSARLALDKIVAQYPESELALVAAQRIAHLDGVEKMMLAKRDPRNIAVPQGVDNVGLLASSEFLKPVEEDPATQAGVYVKHLEKHPLDTEVREKLAVIYADHYQRLDMAVMELAQMINLPNQPPKRVAHWLTVLANLQIRHGADYDTVRQTLEKIVKAFPDLPVAQSAQSRLNHLKLEFKGRQEQTPGKKLGVYEQNIGLKYGPPKQDQG